MVHVRSVTARAVRAKARTASLPEVQHFFRGRERALRVREHVVASREREAPQVNLDLAHAAYDAIDGVQDAARLAVVHLEGTIDERLSSALAGANAGARYSPPPPLAPSSAAVPSPAARRCSHVCMCVRVGRQCTRSQDGPR